MLDREQFIEWLSQHSENTIVGYFGIQDACPLAVYLQKSQKQPFIQVDGENITLHGKIIEKLPKWAIDFMGQLGQEQRLVTAGECLRLLRSV